MSLFLGFSSRLERSRTLNESRCFHVEEKIEPGDQVQKILGRKVFYALTKLCADILYHSFVLHEDNLLRARGVCVGFPGWQSFT